MSTINAHSQFTFDSELELKVAGLVGATASGSIILDIGAGLVDNVAVIDVSAIEVATGDEKYTIHIEGSTIAAMTSGSVTLANLPLGIATAPADSTTTTGRFVLPFRNEQNGTLYRYIRVSTTVAGTIDSGGINYSAFVSTRG